MFSMQVEMHLFIDLMRLFRGVEGAEMSLVVEDAELRPELIPAFGNSSKAYLVWIVTVKHIDCARYITQVFDPVIAGIAVNVVDVAIRKLTVMPKPDKAMRFVIATVKSDDAIARRLNAPGNVTNFDAPACYYLPDQIPRRRVVIEEFMKSGLRNHAVVSVSCDESL